jgi:hypothetical protein
MSAVATIAESETVEQRSSRKILSGIFYLRYI